MLYTEWRKKLNVTLNGIYFQCSFKTALKKFVLLTPQKLKGLAPQHPVFIVR